MPSICLVSHETSSASNYYRTTLPHRHCREALAAEGVELAVVEPGGNLEGHDCYVFCRVVPLDLYPFITHLAASGVPFAYDLDDNFAAIPEWSPAFGEFTHGYRGAATMTLALAGRVSASTLALSEAVGQADKTTVLPNLIDPADWPAPARRRSARCLILWQGSRTHEEDLRVALPALRHVRERFGDAVEIAVAGYCPDWLRDEPAVRPLVLFGWPIGDHARALALLAPNIGIAPLADDAGSLPFNACKSDVKVLEYAAAGATAVASDVGPYRQHPLAAVTPNDPRSWCDTLGAAVRHSLAGLELATTPYGRKHLAARSWGNESARGRWLDFFRALAHDTGKA